MKTSQRHLIKFTILLVLLCPSYMAMAGNWTGTPNYSYYGIKPNSDHTFTLYRSNSSGTFTSDDMVGTYDAIGALTIKKSVTIRFMTTGADEYVYFVGKITVTGGGNLTLRFSEGEEVPYISSTIKRGTGYTNGPFIEMTNTTSDANDCKVSIYGRTVGNTTYYFRISGGADSFAINNHVPSSSATKAADPLIVMNGGTLSLDKVRLNRHWNTAVGEAGAIQINNGAQSANIVTIDNSIITECVANTMGAAILLNDNNTNSIVTLNNTEITSCVTNTATSSETGTYYGGIIRSTAANRCRLTIIGGKIHHNHNRGSSSQNKGIIGWECNADQTLLEITGCEIYSNWTASDGGGIYSNGNVEISNCSIHDNQARRGAGIYIWSESGASTRPEVTVKDNSEIYNNTAYSTVDGNGNGGGIYVRYNSVLNLFDSEVTGNTANYEWGGGISVFGTINVAGKVLVTGNKYNNAPNDVAFPNGGDVGYVHIVNNETNDGLTCGSLIGVYKTTNYVGTSPNNYSIIADGTTAQCVKAFNADFFFDDRSLCEVCTSGTSPFSTDKLYFMGTGYTNTWDAQASSAVSGTDYILSGSLVTHIKTAEGLAWFCNDINEHSRDYSGQTVYLDNDINLSNHNWKPIATYDECNTNTPTFNGVFDGQGHSISGLTSIFPYYQMGLFGVVDGGTIKNTVVTGSLNASGATSMGGLVGDLKDGSVFNCGSAVALSGGSTMGGLVGQIGSDGSLKNSYAILSSGNGLAGNNAGTIENCYVSGGATTLVGNNTGTMNYCYLQGGSTSGTNSSFTAATSNHPYLYRDLDEQVTTVAGNSNIPSHSNKQLVQTLNNWVATNTTYAKWGRPTTATINGDYPILMMPGCNAVAANSSSPNELHYGDINTLLANYTAATQAIYLYQSAANISSNTSSSAKLYIDPDAAVTQAGDVNAYVGVWLDNTAGANGANPTQGGTDTIDWHLFSSALYNQPIGFTYNTADYTPGHGNNPPAVTFTTPKTGYFPTNLASFNSEWDFYSYSEPDYHWVNMKRDSDDHWHSDYNYWPINYTNEDHFVGGRGYLVATAEDCFLQAYGQLNNGDITAPTLSYTPGIAFTTREGFNVLGNPYQSYLDFDAFADNTTNSAIWQGGKTNSGYIALDEDQQGYIYYAYRSSSNPYGGSQYLHPHQGFIVMVEKAGVTPVFTNAMRSTTATATFRDDERPDYPLVNLIVTEDNGNRDLCTVELGRPDKGGFPKPNVRAGKCGISCSYEGTNYAIAFTQPGISEVGIHFETAEDDAFTMTWDTENGDFSYLHLIDNMTGSDIDCLTTDEYRFSASPDDYKSRFRLVFGYTGIDEPEVPEPVEGPTNFAFIMGSQLVVNGEGTLRMFDVTGRMMMEKTVSGTQTVTELPDITAGVYVLQLVGSNGNKTQKIVIQ